MIEFCRRASPRRIAIVRTFQPLLQSSCWWRAAHFLVLVGQLTVSAAADESLAEVDYSNELPRVAPLEPEAALKSFRVADGFTIELAAAEPLVTDPVSMAFDEDGRLFVVEMRGYSEDGDDLLGRVRLLEDTDGNGQFDRSTIYADGLSWPTGIACFDGGVFVGAAPDILYLKDVDGDRRADRREIVFTGFGRGNVQGLLNGFRWGLDHHIHVAAGRGGGTIRNLAHPDADPVELNGRDIAFNPRTLRLKLVSGGGQFGMSFNRWGEKFVCSNSDHLQMILAEDRYLQRNPFQVGAATRRSIAADGPQASVFRISPVEPWRIVRTRLRVAGTVPGPVEGGGTPAGYFTSATGITIYEGDAWPDQYRGWAIVADVGSNLVHRKQLVPDGVTYIGQRVDQQSEFLASSDTWFRPVQFCNGPDGALYVADMYREVVEHPLSLPPVIKRHLDLTSGRDRGRIYRLVPTGSSAGTTTRLGNLPATGLVELLDHPNAWHRRTAARLFVERQDVASATMLHSVATAGATPEGRISALSVLEGLDQLEQATLLAALSDKHSHVRRHAIRLSEDRLDTSQPLAAKLSELVADPSVVVRYQLAFSLGESDHPKRLESLAALARRDIDNADVSGAVLSSLRRGAAQVRDLLVANDQFVTDASGSAFLKALEDQLGREESQEPHETPLLTQTPTDNPTMIQNEISPERQHVYESYRTVLETNGNAEQGKRVFSGICAACHKVGDVGLQIGPNLAAMKNRGAEVMLYNILIPNREVDPKFQTYIIVTTAGQVITGVIAAETATSVTLINMDGTRHAFLRIDIDEMINTGRSMMPSGIESQINHQQMTDLLAFLLSAQ